MVEHVSIYKAITSVYEGGLSHKSVVVRTHVAMLVDHVVTALGPEKFFGSSKDTQVFKIFEKKPFKFSYFCMNLRL